MLAAYDSDNRIHSMALFVYDETICYYLLAGNQPELNAKSCANSLIVWEGIKLAAKMSNVFDFEGSMTQSIERFFRKFGATPTTYYAIRKQSFLRQIFAVIKPGIKNMLGHK